MAEDHNPRIQVYPGTDVKAGRVALVTGAGRNLGRVVSLALAATGLDVAVNVREDRAEAERVCRELEALGVRTIPVVADVADEDAVAAMFTAVEQDLGPVAVLINNAAPRGEGRIEDLSRADWDRVVGAGLTGAFHTCRAAVPAMRLAGWGRIINVLGAVAHQGQPNRVHMAASKAGLLGLTRALAAEVGAAGITVNAVSPGPLDTAVPAGIDPSLWLERARGKPIPRLGHPEEVAAAVTFLTSDLAGFITGQAIGVNGGEVMLG
ncbi:MAG: 3-oxoacyl-[acyl-carrier-protein] reductase [Pseudarthrobacter sp.]